MIFKNPTFFAFLSILFWSTAATAFKLTLKFLSYTQLLFYASLVSFFIFFLSLFFSKDKELLKKFFSKKGLLFSLIGGFINPFLYYLILFKAYSLLPAQEAMVLNYTWPLALIILSYPLLGEKPSLKVIMGMGISFLGVLVVAKIWESPWVGRPEELLGMFLAIGSSFFWGLSWILNVKDKRDDRIKLGQNFFFGTLFSGLYILINSSFSWPNAEGGWGLLYIGCFEMGFTFLFWLKALKYAKNIALVGRLIFIIPFSSLLVISLVIKGPIYLSSIGGLALIILGILGPKFVPNSFNRRARVVKC